MSLPYTITGLYYLRRPKVPPITISTNKEDAEKVREAMLLAIDGVKPNSPSSTTASGEKDKYKHRFALLDNNYSPLGFCIARGPNVAAVSLSKHSPSGVFYIVYANTNEIRRDKYGNHFITVYEYTQTKLPVEKHFTIKSSGKTGISRTEKKITRINTFKVFVEQIE